MRVSLVFYKWKFFSLIYLMYTGVDTRVSTMGFISIKKKAKQRWAY